MSFLHVFLVAVVAERCLVGTTVHRCVLDLRLLFLGGRTCCVHGGASLSLLIGEYGMWRGCQSPPREIGRVRSLNRCLVAYPAVCRGCGNVPNCALGVRGRRWALFSRPHFKYHAPCHSATDAVVFSCDTTVCGLPTTRTTAERGMWMFGHVF